MDVVCETEASKKGLINPRGRLFLLDFLFYRQRCYKSKYYMGTIKLSRPLFMGADSFESNLGLKNGFFEKLQEEDDW